MNACETSTARSGEASSLTIKRRELALLTCYGLVGRISRTRAGRVSSGAIGDSPAALRPRRKGGNEASAAILRLDLRGRHRAVPRRHRRGGRPVLAFLQGLAGLFAAAGLRAAGDDAGARDRRLAGRRIRRASGGSICRSRRSRSWCSTPSSRPRTRTSTSTAGSTSRASRAPACSMLQNYGTGRRPQGASTITQQVAKNFLLTNEVSLRAQDQGSAARAEDRAHLFEGQDPRALSQRNLSRARRLRRRGRLAALFRQVGARADAGGSRLSGGAAEGAEQLSSVPPARARDRAPQLRASTAWSRTATSSREDGEKAKKEPLAVTPRPTGAHIFAAEYFAEEVRRDLNDRYGEKKLYEGGLSVRTTLDPKLQSIARKALTDGLVKFDETARLSRRDPEARHLRRLGREARRREGALRHRAVAARGGARGQRSVRPHRAAARARAGRRRRRRTGDRQHPARRREMGQGRDRAGPRQDAVARSARCSAAGDVVYVEPLDKDAGKYPPAPGPGNLRRHRGDGPADRPRARDGRRLLVRPEPVQPRHAGAAPARLLVQAVRLCGRARQWLHALDRRDGCADRGRYRARAAACGSRKTIRTSSTGRRRCASASSIRAT